MVFDVHSSTPMCVGNAVSQSISQPSGESSRKLRCVTGSSDAGERGNLLLELTGGNKTDF